jgi:hypothetical protein
MGAQDEQSYLRDMGDLFLKLQALTDPELAPALDAFEESVSLNNALQDGRVIYVGLDAMRPCSQTFRNLGLNDLREIVTRRYSTFCADTGCLKVSV